MVRFKFIAVALVVGFVPPLGIGIAAAQSDPYASPRPHTNNYTKGVQTYDAKNDANVRLGTACSLRIQGDEVYRGICNIGRRDNVSIIDTGMKRYKIVRDEFDRKSAKLYAPNDRFLADLYASGSCWEGDEGDTRFCAN